MKAVVLLFLFFVFLGGLLGIFFFFKKKEDRTANTILGIYTLLFALEMLNNCLRWSGKLSSPSFVHFNLIHFPIWLVYGPLVFIYVRRVVTKIGFKLSDVLFFVPAMVLVILVFPFYVLGTEKKLEVVTAGQIYEYALFPYYATWIVLALMFFFGLYTLYSFGNNKRVGFRESTWLKCFVGSYFGFVFAFFLYVFLVRFGIMDARYDYFIDLVIVLFIGMLTFFGFVQPEVFNGKQVKELIPFVKYRKTGLSTALSLEMKEKLLHIMKEQKPYLNNELRLNDVADLLHLSRNHASQIINEHFNLSFFDFINKYRVEEAKKLLLADGKDKTTISQIAYDAGFNNRASFYKAFKKFTDSSPKEYLHHMLAS